MSAVATLRSRGAFIAIEDMMTTPSTPSTGQPDEHLMGVEFLTSQMTLFGTGWQSSGNAGTHIKRLYSLPDKFDISRDDLDFIMNSGLNDEPSGLYGTDDSQYDFTLHRRYGILATSRPATGSDDRKAVWDGAVRPFLKTDVPSVPSSNRERGYEVKPDIPAAIWSMSKPNGEFTEGTDVQIAQGSLVYFEIIDKNPDRWVYIFDFGDQGASDWASASKTKATQQYLVIVFGEDTN